jgi:hypothetical protein
MLGIPAETRLHVKSIPDYSQNRVKDGPSRKSTKPTLFDDVSLQDVARKGLYGAPKIRVVASADAHAAVHKSISMLGLGSENVELVPVDDQDACDLIKCRNWMKRR